MNIPTNIIALVFVLSFLIFFHEAGHFLIAKLFRFPVEIFSLGFGKRLFGFQRRGTDYRVSLIPLGGYVKVVGLGPDESDVVSGAAQEATSTGSRWQRLLILFAGPGVNLVLALLLTAFALMIGVNAPRHLEEKPVVKHVDSGSPAEVAGVRVDDVILKLSGRSVATWREVETDLGLAPREKIPVELLRGDRVVTVEIRPEPRTEYDIGYTGLNPFVPAIVERLAPGYPGEKAGLRRGDRILAVSGREVAGFYEVMHRIRELAADFDARGARPIELVIDRAGVTERITLTPVKEGSSWKIGFSPRAEQIRRRLAFREALAASWRENLQNTRAVFSTVRRLVTGGGSLRQLSGPIDIAKFSGEAARSGAADLLNFMGLLSLQLGLLNLLPIPLLDGGQIFITLLESVARRDFPLRVKERLMQAGLVFLVFLMIAVLCLDVLKNV